MHLCEVELLLHSILASWDLMHEAEMYQVVNNLASGRLLSDSTVTEARII